MLSFPRPGYTLAVDSALKGRQTLELCSQLDRLVVKYDGVIYPAKDARMKAVDFQRFFQIGKILPIILTRNSHQVSGGE
jgi:hypothetical protein